MTVGPGRPPRAPAREIACPTCDTTREVRQHPNAKLRCAKCRTLYLVPGPDTATGTAVEVPAEPEPELEPEHQEPEPEPAKVSEHQVVEPVEPAAGELGPSIIRPDKVTIAPAAPPPTGRAVDSAPANVDQPVSAGGELEAPATPVPELEPEHQEPEPRARRSNRSRRPWSRRT